MTQGVFLVGGLGTRLGPLVQHVPKPMLPVAGRPFLDHLIAWAVRQGVNDILLLAGYRGEVIGKRYAHHSIAGARIRCFIESEPLGTAGAIGQITPYLVDHFFLFNGDSWADIDLSSLAATPVAGDWLAQMALVTVDDGRRYGGVSLHGSRVTGFAEHGGPAAGLINAGIYRIRRDALPPLGLQPCSLERDLLPPAATAGRLFGRTFDGFFIDIGVPQDLERARNLLPHHLSQDGAEHHIDAVNHFETG